MRRGIPTIVKEIQDSVRRGEPWNLTFAPCGTLSVAERHQLQNELEKQFKLWANSWVLPGLEEIAEKATR